MPFNTAEKKLREDEGFLLEREHELCMHNGDVEGESTVMAHLLLSLLV
jgi:hypothetical protein